MRSNFRGACKHSNNAGEVTALLRAIEDEASRAGAVVFCTDSTYAMQVARGAWLTRRKHPNAEIAKRLRRAYRRLVQSRADGEVTIRHVRAHVGVRGNEAADRLAKAGAKLREGAEYQVSDVSEEGCPLCGACDRANMRCRVCAADREGGQGGGPTPEGARRRRTPRIGDG